MNRIAAGAGVAITAACLLLACLGSDPDPVTPEKDGGSSSGGNADGGPLADGSLADGTAVADGGPTDSGYAPPAGNVLERSDFEQGAGCLAWTSNQASLDQDPSYHTGKSSCRVCASPSITSVWGIYQNAKPSLPLGDYTINAFVHAAEDPRGPQHIVIRANLVDSAGNELPDANGVERTLNVAPGDVEWQHATFDYSVLAANQTISVGALVSAPLEGCFLVDDFTVSPKK